MSIQCLEVAAANCESTVSDDNLLTYFSLESPHFNLADEGSTTGDEDDEDDYEEAYENALGKRPELPDTVQTYINVAEFEKVFALFYACTDQDPAKRPSAKDILDILEADDNSTGGEGHEDDSIVSLHDNSKGEKAALPK